MLCMAKIVRFTFRLSSKEFELLKNQASFDKASTISDFIRSRVLEKDLWLEKRVQEIYVVVKSIQDSLRKD